MAGNVRATVETQQLTVDRAAPLPLKDVRLLCVNIDRALIFGYDFHEHFMQLILKFGQYLQHSLFIT